MTPETMNMAIELAYKITTKWQIEYGDHDLQCFFCGRECEGGEEPSHKKDCPVKLANKILKETKSHD